MKEFIIMTAMVMLGVFIFNLIAGSGDDSIINALEKMFRHEIAARGAGF